MLQAHPGRSVRRLGALAVGVVLLLGIPTAAMAAPGTTQDENEREPGEELSTAALRPTDPANLGSSWRSDAPGHSDIERKNHRAERGPDSADRAGPPAADRGTPGEPAKASETRGPDRPDGEPASPAPRASATAQANAASASRVARAQAQVSPDATPPPPAPAPAPRPSDPSTRAPETSPAPNRPDPSDRVLADIADLQEQPQPAMGTGTPAAQAATFTNRASTAPQTAASSPAASAAPQPRPTADAVARDAGVVERAVRAPSAVLRDTGRAVAEMLPVPLPARSFALPFGVLAALGGYLIAQRRFRPGALPMSTAALPQQEGVRDRHRL